MRTTIALGLLLANCAPLQAANVHTVAYTGTHCTTPADGDACIFRAADQDRFEATSSRHASFLRLQAGFSADSIFESFGLGGGFIDIVDAEAPYDGWSLAELLNLRELIGASENDNLGTELAQSQPPSAEDIDKALQEIFDKRAEYAAQRDRDAKAAEAKAADAKAAEAAQGASKGVSQAQIDKALADLLATRESWGTSPWDTAVAGSGAKVPTAVTSAELAVLPTELATLLAMRESWGRGAAPKTVVAPLAAGASFPLPKSPPTETGSVEGKAAGAVIINPLEPRPPVELTPVPGRQVDIALADLLAKRAQWAAGKSSVARAVLPTDSLDALLAERAAWGSGEAAKPVAAPLAAGATSPLPKTSAGDQVSATDGAPIINAPDLKPVAELQSVPQAQIDSELDKLLAERKSWGDAPAKTGDAAAAPSVADGSRDEGYAVLATDSLDALLKQREAWGKGDGERVMLAPLAAGARMPLPQSATAPQAAAAGEPIVNAADLKPVAELQPVPQSQIDSELEALLETREGWGTAPAGSAGGAATAEAASGVDASTCQDRLAAIMSEGTIQFGLGSASIEDASQATVQRIADVAKGCAGVMIRVEGHTDSSGSAAFNLSLSQQRAAAVKDALVAAGVPAERLEAKGFGESQPLVANTTAANRAKNRRIDFKVETR